MQSIKSEIEKDNQKVKNLSQNHQQILDSWKVKLDQLQIPKTFMNRIVLNFLIIEGYKEGARKFVKEANIDLDAPENIDLKVDMNEELMDQRMEVRRLILRGQLKQAINQINEINPIILENNPELSFELAKHQLIEIMKTGNIQEAIKYSQNEIADKFLKQRSQFKQSEEKASEIHILDKLRAEKFQRDLEQTMMLLIFEQLTTESGDEQKAKELFQQLPPSLKELLNFSSRQKLASEANKAILVEMGYQSEHKLGFFWQMCQWSQEELKKKLKDEQKDEIQFPILKSAMGDLELQKGEQNYFRDCIDQEMNE